MSNINKIIEKQREIYLDKIKNTYELCIDNDGGGKLNDNERILEIDIDGVWDWHKQSIITLLDTLIEEKKGMKKEKPKGNDIPFDWGIEDPEDEYKRKGYNDCLDEDITNLTNIKNNIK